jgi:hypothetical protein
VDDKEVNKQTERAAFWLRDQLQQLGLQTQLHYFPIAPG